MCLWCAQRIASPLCGSGMRSHRVGAVRGYGIREGRQPTHHPQVFAPLVLSPFPWLFRGEVLFCASRRGSTAEGRRIRFALRLCLVALPRFMRGSACGGDASLSARLVLGAHSRFALRALCAARYSIYQYALKQSKSASNSASLL